MSVPMDPAVKTALGTVMVLVSDRCMYDEGMFSSRLATCQRQKRDSFIDFTPTSKWETFAFFLELSIKCWLAVLPWWQQLNWILNGTTNDTLLFGDMRPTNQSCCASFYTSFMEVTWQCGRSGTHTIVLSSCHKALQYFIFETRATFFRKPMVLSHAGGIIYFLNSNIYFPHSTAFLCSWG